MDYKICRSQGKKNFVEEVEILAKNILFSAPFFKKLPYLLPSKCMTKQPFIPLTLSQTG